MAFTGDGIFEIQLAHFATDPRRHRSPSRPGMLRSRASDLGLSVRDAATSFEPMTARDERRELVRALYEARRDLRAPAATRR